MNLQDDATASAEAPVFSSGCFLLLLVQTEKRGVSASEPFSLSEIFPDPAS